MAKKINTSQPKPKKLNEGRTVPKPSPKPKPSPRLKKK